MIFFILFIYLLANTHSPLIQYVHLQDLYCMCTNLSGIHNLAELTLDQLRWFMNILISANPRFSLVSTKI